MSDLAGLTVPVVALAGVVLATAAMLIPFRRRQRSRLSPGTVSTQPIGPGVTVQSSVGEECLYRLLVPAGALAIGVPLPVALALGIVIWVGTHPQGEVEPVLARVLELTIMGLVVTALLWNYGLLAAVAAHLSFNLAVLISPLLEHRLIVRRSAIGHR